VKSTIGSGAVLSLATILTAAILLSSPTAAQRRGARPAAPVVQREVVSVPVQPLQTRCTSLLPSARVRGRPVQLRLQYCGYLSTMPSGRQGVAYFALASPDGRLPDLWPGAELQTTINQVIGDYGRHYGGDLSPLHANCLQAPPARARLVLCGQVALASGDPASAIRFASQARVAGLEGAGVVLALAAARDPAGGNWAQRRATMRAALRNARSPVANQLLDLDNLLAD